MPTFQTAFDFLQGEGPEVFGTSVGSLLYVGHRSDTHPWWWQTFAPVIGVNRIAVVDLVARNLESAAGITTELYHGDVRDYGLVPPGFGLVFWDEGPEHLPREQALSIITELRDRHSGVLISCPWGYQPQGSGPDDPEFHHWAPQCADFESIGMTARAFGTEFRDGGGHGNLIAWLY